MLHFHKKCWHIVLVICYYVAFVNYDTILNTYMYFILVLLLVTYFSLVGKKTVPFLFLSPIFPDNKMKMDLFAAWLLLLVGQHIHQLAFTRISSIFGHCFFLKNRSRKG
ncbi:hypothetical protein L1049_016884 [Liquidambar formosana]|uniref:Uncharacterized protein n=1 Tax=Liquidambar formosana TaxID=63359 RepID=A0AAP0X3R6_LIQFO